MLIWNVFSFEGVQKRVEIGPPELDIQHVKFFGVPGVSAIDGEVGVTPLACEMWLNKQTFTTAQSVAQFLSKLFDYVGFSDDLIEAGLVDRTFRDCEFRGFEQLGDILPAIGVGMFPSTFWVRLRLNWLQLTPEILA